MLPPLGSVTVPRIRPALPCEKAGRHIRIIPRLATATAPAPFLRLSRTSVLTSDVKCFIRISFGKQVRRTSKDFDTTNGAITQRPVTLKSKPQHQSDFGQLGSSAIFNLPG